MARSASDATGGLPAGLGRAVLRVDGLADGLAARRAAAARPPGSARAATRPTWRCGARSTSAWPGARRGRDGRRLTGPAATGAARSGCRRVATVAARSRPSRRPLVAPRSPPRRRPPAPRSRAARRAGRDAHRRRHGARLPEPGARITDTSGARWGVPFTSMRPSIFSGERAGLAGVSDRTSMPSRPDLDVGPQHGADRLARRHERRRRPCPWAGARPRRARSRTRRPSGWSTRYRCGVTCGGHATSPDAPRAGPDAGLRRRRPVTWPRTSTSCGSSRTGDTTVARRGGPCCPFRRIHMSEDTESPGRAGYRHARATRRHLRGCEPPGRRRNPAGHRAPESPPGRRSPRSRAPRPDRPPGRSPPRPAAGDPRSGRPRREAGQRRRTVLLPPAAPRPSHRRGEPRAPDPVSPVASVAPAAVPFTYPPPNDRLPGAGPPAERHDGAPRAGCGPGSPWPSWPPSSAACVGAGVTAIADNNNNGNGTA